MDSAEHAAGFGGAANTPVIERMGLADIVLAWAADSSISDKEIARRLQDEYGVRIGGSSVSKWLGKQRGDRRVALAQAVANDPALQETLSKHLTNDLEIVDHLIKDLLDTYDGVKGIESKVDLARAAFDGLRTKTKLMGIDGPVSPATAVAISVAGGGGRLRDLSDEELGRLLALAGEGAQAGERGAEGVPLSEGGGVTEPEESPEASRGEADRRSSSTEGRSRERPGEW